MCGVWALKIHIVVIQEHFSVNRNWAHRSPP